MSTQQRYELVPEWSLGDRLRKARSLTGMTVSEFAEAIGVSDRTINNAEGDKRAVRKITLNAWAMATGVSLEWLETGIAGSEPTPPDRGQSGDALAKLTEQKQRRSRGSGTTRRYLAPALAAA